MKRQHPKFDDNMLKELKDLKEAQAYPDVAL